MCRLFLWLIYIFNHCRSTFTYYHFYWDISCKKCVTTLLLRIYISNLLQDSDCCHRQTTRMDPSWCGYCDAIINNIRSIPSYVFSFSASRSRGLNTEASISIPVFEEHIYIAPCLGLEFLISMLMTHVPWSRNNTSMLLPMTLGMNTKSQKNKEVMIMMMMREDEHITTTTNIKKPFQEKDTTETLGPNVTFHSPRGFYCYTILLY